MPVCRQTRRQSASVARCRPAAACRPEVALLVSTFEKPWHLERVLASIAAQQGVEGKFELVVTDDGSADETAGIVERFARSVRFPVAWTSHPHDGFQLARCRNEGAAASTAPYLLFLDGDCVLPPDHVRQHLLHRGVNWVMGGYCCRLDPPTTERFSDEVIRRAEYLGWVSRRERRALAQHARKARLYQLLRHPTKPKLFGGNIGIWRKDYQRVNGYDENFQGWGCEDDDLRLRLRLAGLRIGSILPWTHTYHLWHPPAPSAPRQWSDGPNVAHLGRRWRLTRCLNGLVKRGLEDLAVRVVGQPAQPEAAAALLKPYRFAEPADAAPADVEILLLPGAGGFSGRADCNILVALEDSPKAARMARKAHLVVAPRPYPGAAPEGWFPPGELGRALQALE